MMSLLFPGQHLQYKAMEKEIEDCFKEHPKVKTVAMDLKKLIQESLQEDLTAEIIEVKASDSSVL